MLEDLGSENAGSVTVNGKAYAVPLRPVAVICFDGCDPSYLDAASQEGVIPNLDRMRKEGFEALALAAVPTFTNPNNVSIVCGAPPAVHGVSGNYYLDRITGREIMMLDEQPLTAPTILAKMSEIGVRVAAITAKDKLRRALGAGFVNGISLSAERPEDAAQLGMSVEELLRLTGRISLPEQYSSDLSLFVLDIGDTLLRQGKAELIYLSLSDYVQHKHGPTEAEALDFMAAVDRRIGSLLDQGAIVGLVADHGMSEMATSDGTPNVIYLGDVIAAEFGGDVAKVICPITDPFVRHHGALGGFVRIHIATNRASELTPSILSFVQSLPGIELALRREEACETFDLPAGPEGDITVFGRKGVALGNHATGHDLSQLAGARLRSHGGLSERSVPFILSSPLTDEYRRRAQTTQLNNFDIFDFSLNGVVSTETA
jgi:phosphonoacetate hydrolase